jgi:sugar phosphate isomerase/epimerase
MKTIKGPGIFLAQFVGDKKPFNNLKNICEWASGLGYKAVQIPTWEEGLIDLKKASESKVYCDEIKGIVNETGMEISELSTHLQGQLVASHYAYDKMFDVFAPKTLQGNVKGRTEWAIDQLKHASNASKHLGLTEMATFSGSLLFHTMYPWPQRPNGLVETGFNELAKRWEPILNHFDNNGVDVCYEIHPGEDLHDGVTFERFLNATKNHSRVKILYDPSHFILQQMDYLKYIDHYHEFIKMFHVKDAEFNPNGKSGVYGGYLEDSDLLEMVK